MGRGGRGEFDGFLDGGGVGPFKCLHGAVLVVFLRFGDRFLTVAARMSSDEGQTIFSMGRHARISFGGDGERADSRAAGVVDDVGDGMPTPGMLAGLGDADDDLMRCTAIVDDGDVFVDFHGAGSL